MGIDIKQLISVRTAALVGSIYFLLLGLINFIATFIYAEIRSLDIITAVVCILPILTRNKTFLMSFGIVTAFISLYLMFAGLVFMADPRVQTSNISFFMGFLLMGSALLSSLLLIFAGISDENLKLNSINKT